MPHARDVAGSRRSRKQASTVDFELDPDQRAVMEAVERLLEGHAGAARAIALHEAGGYDTALHATLAEAGFLDVAADGGMGLLEAALVTEAVARAGGVMAAGAAAMIAAPTAVQPTSEPLALVEAAGRTGPIRHLTAARGLLSIEADAVRWIALEEGDVEPVASNFGYPMGRLRGSVGRGRVVDGVSRERVTALWRLAIAAEAVGSMEAALRQTTGYLTQRRQFGQAIGSFQGVQHRLAECAIQIEAARWLVREAAHQGASSEAVATAAAFAVAAAELVFAETHQLSGAIGFTREHDLHVWSMRLQALRLELGGARAHRRTLAATRWGAPA
jgi:alkylation response protein AidB-like acyl-CoA dehydrogenase